MRILLNSIPYVMMLLIHAHSSSAWAQSGAQGGGMFHFPSSPEAPINTSFPEEKKLGAPAEIPSSAPLVETEWASLGANYPKFTYEGQEYTDYFYGDPEAMWEFFDQKCDEKLKVLNDLG